MKRDYPLLCEDTYKKAWDNVGKDGAKAAEALGLTEVPKDYNAFIALCHRRTTYVYSFMYIYIYIHTCIMHSLALA